MRNRQGRGDKGERFRGRPPHRRPLFCLDREVPRGAFARRGCTRRSPTKGMADSPRLSCRSSRTPFEPNLAELVANSKTKKSWRAPPRLQLFDGVTCSNRSASNETALTRAIFSSVSPGTGGRVYRPRRMSRPERSRRARCALLVDRGGRRGWISSGRLEDRQLMAISATCRESQGQGKPASAKKKPAGNKKMSEGEFCSID